VLDQINHLTRLTDATVVNSPRRTRKITENLCQLLYPAFDETRHAVVSFSHQNDSTTPLGSLFRVRVRIIASA
jgi:hypothetical protein